jgi:hypothetical protein
MLAALVKDFTEPLGRADLPRRPGRCRRHGGEAPARRGARRDRRQAGTISIQPTTSALLTLGARSG